MQPYWRRISNYLTNLPNSEIAAKECKACMECFLLCPASYLQAAYVLVEALAFPPAR